MVGIRSFPIGNHRPVSFREGNPSQNRIHHPVENRFQLVPNWGSRFCTLKTIDIFIRFIQSRGEVKLWISNFAFFGSFSKNNPLSSKWWQDDGNELGKLLWVGKLQDISQLWSFNSNRFVFGDGKPPKKWLELRWRRNIIPFIQDYTEWTCLRSFFSGSSKNIRNILPWAWGRKYGKARLKFGMFHLRLSISSSQT